MNLAEFSGVRIVIHPGARDKYKHFVKCWPLENYIELIQRLTRLENTQTVIIGTEKEQDLLQKYESFLKCNNVISLAGQTSIAMHFSVIKTAALFIGNNSGALHIAAAYNIPVITFAGGVPMVRWSPPQKAKNIVLGLDKRCPDCKEWNCDKNGLPCLEAISVDEVFEAVKIQLKWV